MTRCGTSMNALCLHMLTLSLSHTLCVHTTPTLPLKHLSQVSQHVVQAFIPTVPWKHHLHDIQDTQLPASSPERYPRHVQSVLVSPQRNAEQHRIVRVASHGIHCLTDATQRRHDCVVFMKGQVSECCNGRSLNCPRLSRGHASPSLSPTHRCSPRSSQCSVSTQHGPYLPINIQQASLDVAVHSVAAHRRQHQLHTIVTREYGHKFVMQRNVCRGQLMPMFCSTASSFRCPIRAARMAVTPPAQTTTAAHVRPPTLERVNTLPNTRTSIALNASNPPVM